MIVELTGLYSAYKVYPNLVFELAIAVGLLYLLMSYPTAVLARQMERRLAREGGHMTEVVEQEDGSLQLRHCNCPIQDVAARSGQPCLHEQKLYERLLGAPLSRSTWVGAGDTSCTYDIKNERKEVG